MPKRVQPGSIALQNPATNPLKRPFQFDWLVAALLVWMFLACCFPLFDTDLFWHLKTGEWILEHGTVPGYDLYTYTNFDQRWIDLHWGFQVVVAVLYRLGGADLLVLAKATTLTVMLGVACYAGGARLASWQRVLCWLLPAITISGRGIERPEIVTQLCLATWLAIVTRLESRPRWIWLLPLLQVFWINFHSLYILGLVVAGCYFVDDVARRFAAGRWQLGMPPQNIFTADLIRAGFLCGAAAFVNPYFEEGALFPFIVLRKFTVEQQVYSTIGEFQPPIRFLMKHGFINLYLDAEILLWLAAAVSFVVLAIYGRYSVFRTVLFAAFSYLAWKASRNTNIFSIVAGYVLTENLGETIAIASKSPANVSRDSSLKTWIERGIGLLLGLMVLAVVSGEWNRRGEEIHPFRLGEARSWYAHDAARFMGRPGFPKFVFAENFGVGSVYTYHNGPEGKVFMDGRLEVCSRQTYERNQQIVRRMSAGDPAWVELLRDKEGTLPAVMLDSRYSRALIQGVMRTPGWQLVYADQAAAVFFYYTVAEALHLPLANPEPLLYPPPF